MNSSPYRMPAEWTLHSGTELHWPHNPSTWPDERLERVRTVYLNLMKILVNFDTIHLFVNDLSTKMDVENRLKAAGIVSGAIVFHLKTTNDTWARDCGPIFVLDPKNQPIISNWDYNAWGEKYPPFDDDNAIPDYVSERYAMQQVKPGMVLEGGSIEVNGEGVLLTTESVLLNPNRNPNLTKKQIEEKLSHFLGLDTIIWLKDGLAGDDTDGHIDDLSRFVNPNTIITMITKDESDVNFQALNENLHILKQAKNQKGEAFNIVEIPMPITKIEGTTVDGSEFVPASYANFYIANDAILLPLYDPKYDHQVLEEFKNLFPAHKVFGIPCSDLVFGQGSIHCITQQWHLK